MSEFDAKRDFDTIRAWGYRLPAAFDLDEFHTTLDRIAAEHYRLRAALEEAAAWPCSRYRHVDSFAECAPSERRCASCVARSALFNPTITTEEP